MDSQDLKKRYDSLVTQRKTLDDTLEEIEQYSEAGSLNR